MLHALHLLTRNHLIRAVLAGDITVLDAQNVEAGIGPTLEVLLRLYRECHKRLIERQPGIETRALSIALLEKEIEGMPAEICLAFEEGRLTLIQARYAHRLDHLRGEAFKKFLARAREKATKALNSIPPEPQLEPAFTPLDSDERERLLRQIAAVNPAHAATAQVLREGSVPLTAIRGYHSKVVAPSHPSA